MTVQYTSVLAKSSFFGVFKLLFRSSTFVLYYTVAQNKIPHQTMCNICATSGLILKILEAA